MGSLRKWYAIPDGGFVAADISLDEDVLKSGEDYARERLNPLTEKWSYLHNNVLLGGTEKERQEKKIAYREKNRVLEEDLDHYAGIRRMSRFTRSILSEIDETGAARKREENYQ